jgi:hypothetical protein
MSELCIGLFGTCGGSTWREDFIKQYYDASLGRIINYYNPVVTDWNPECAKEEASHLANDSIILFPVLDETYAFGSLTEIGFSVLQALRLDDRRDLVVLIEDHLTEELMKDEDLAKESLKGRALVYEHLKKLALPNVYLVDTLDEMREVSIALYMNQANILPYRTKFNPHLRKY